ncbi:Lsr2 protein [Nocardia amikacinitolerans]|nr:Lsr2 protein [Nocardia amikacinitolerans]
MGGGEPVGACSGVCDSCLSIDFWSGLVADPGAGRFLDELRVGFAWRKAVVTVVDDFDGRSQAAETVSFAMDGVDYEIDLSQENAARLRDVFALWVSHGRRVSRSGRRSKRVEPAGGTGHSPIWYGVGREPTAMTCRGAVGCPRRLLRPTRRPRPKGGTILKWWTLPAAEAADPPSEVEDGARFPVGRGNAATLSAEGPRHSHPPRRPSRRRGVRRVRIRPRRWRCGFRRRS